MPNFASAEAFIKPHQVTGGSTPSGVSTTLAAAADAGDTNVKLTSVSDIAIGQLVQIGTGADTFVAEIVGPTDSSGVFEGTSGSGGTGADLDRALVVDIASGEPVVQKDDIAVTLDTNTGISEITWAQSQLPTTHFFEYTVYRKNLKTGQFDPIAYITDQSILSWEDAEAYIGAQNEYRVTQDNAALESDPAYAAILVENTDWYWSVPGRTDLVTKLQVLDYDIGEEPTVDLYVGIGARDRLVEAGEVLSVNGTFTLQVLDRAILRIIEESVKSTDTPYIAIRNYYGEVFRVKATGRLTRRPFGGPLPAGEVYQLPVTTVASQTEISL